MLTTQQLYEVLHEVSEQMVSAAHANDWDRLSALDAEMTAARENLQRTAERESIDDGALVRRAALIAAILENNREVRRHVDPWMASTRKLFSSGERDRAVRAAYGAPPR